MLFGVQRKAFILKLYHRMYFADKGEHFLCRQPQFIAIKSPETTKERTTTG
jgi:hypothetical protein